MEKENQRSYLITAKEYIRLVALTTENKLGQEKLGVMVSVLNSIVRELEVEILEEGGPNT